MTYDLITCILFWQSGPINDEGWYNYNNMCVKICVVLTVTDIAEIAKRMANEFPREALVLFLSQEINPISLSCGSNYETRISEMLVSWLAEYQRGSSAVPKCNKQKLAQILINIGYKISLHEDESRRNYVKTFFDNLAQELCYGKSIVLLLSFTLIF